MNYIQNAIRAIMPKEKSGVGGALKEMRARKVLGRDANLSITLMMMDSRTLM